ncbi:hypothetical protein CLOM_g23334 [Closterium sp. NIES-68]|nr:hypothetical protein CLOM_g10204 [Closterium sp. NIES-68]GJP38924.1 hypothetical protein CLOM_g23334 [Closterium sp. NIES-68]GJP67334.1 hypothetical protein CLOP_g24162 [Closterium sp. NIES-67]GJP84747.1 hypothetical protein CLOP_g14806 [Closterium sp. NIES-67]
MVLCGFPTYVSKTLCKTYRRIQSEVAAEWPLFKEKWTIIVSGILFQFIHGFLTRTAHFLHAPRPLLHDVGFELVPEIGPENFFISEYLFFAIFIPCCIWTFHPFVCTKKQFYTVLLWCKVLTVFVICQTLRVLSFTATQLPGPAPHCRQGSPTAILKYTGLHDVLHLNAMHGCGDLIFSSHMTFILTVVITYSRYGTNLFFKHLSWLLSGVMSVLIVASRKHYTVDVVIAWYVVPLVYFFVEHKLEDCVGPRDLLERSLCDKVLPLHASPFHLSSQVQTPFEARISKHHAYNPVDQDFLARWTHGLKKVREVIRFQADNLPDEGHEPLKTKPVLGLELL